MSDFWDNAPILGGLALFAFLLYGFGYIGLVDIKQSQVRYEQCIAAGMQWVEGNCVK